jgi:hypothetical protein
MATSTGLSYARACVSAKLAVPVTWRYRVGDYEAMGERVFGKVPFTGGGHADGMKLDVPEQDHGRPAERVYVTQTMEVVPDQIGNVKPDDAHLYLRDMAEVQEPDSSTSPGTAPSHGRNTPFEDYQYSYFPG